MTSRNSGSIFLRGHEVVEIAEKLRYNNSQNFIRVFERINGTTPGEFRTSRAALKSHGSLAVEED
ncbi:AraC family transcriptional regulator [Paenibacillus residui]|uniref:AraC family transcriptional regulator n=1 Tax=Paenibacillus residui TaxID=629724 RepID=A0ABW3D8R6_9BACL